MTLNVCEEISSVELIKLKENIASLQLCLPGIIIYNLKLHKKKTNIENCLTHDTIHFSFCPSVLCFVFATLLKGLFTVVIVLYFTRFS